MRHRAAISIIVTLIFAASSLPGFAGFDMRASVADRAWQADRDRDRDRGRDRDIDRSRAADRDREFRGDRSRDRNRLGIPDQDRDRLNAQNPLRMQDEEIYGYEFMTVAERNVYRDQLANTDSPEARVNFQARHEETMRERALELGADLVPPGQGPVYGGELMTVQERNRYRERLRWLETDEERERFNAKHRERMEERARALGHVIEGPR